MATQTTLVPSLLALHSPISLPLLLSRLSLQALHIQPYHIRDDIYQATTSVLPGQLRSLRLRAERVSTAGVNRKGKEKAVVAEANQGDDDDWEYSLAYLSPPLNGREYAEMSVRACIGLEIVRGKMRKDIENFIEVLGFKHSHSYSRTGYLIHLPLPLPSSTPMTIHLTITRLQSKPNPAEMPDRQASTSEPYLLMLQPSRPVHAVSVRGEPGLEDTMRVMREVSERVEGVQWETGRA